MKPLTAPLKKVAIDGGAAFEYLYELQLQGTEGEESYAYPVRREGITLQVLGDCGFKGDWGIEAEELLEGAGYTTSVAYNEAQLVDFPQVPGSPPGCGITATHLVRERPPISLPYLWHHLAFPGQTLSPKRLIIAVSWLGVRRKQDEDEATSR